MSPFNGRNSDFRRFPQIMADASILWQNMRKARDALQFNVIAVEPAVDWLGAKGYLL